MVMMVRRMGMVRWALMLLPAWAILYGPGRAAAFDPQGAQKEDAVEVEKAAITELSKLGAGFELNPQGRVRAVVLSGRRFRDDHLKQVAKFPELDTLVIDEAQVTDAGLAHVKGAKELVELVAAGLPITDAGMKVLQNFSALKRLNLSSCRRITAGGMQNLAGLRNLEELNLQDTTIADQGLAHLSKLVRLKSLNLEGIRVGDAGVAHLKTLTALRTLNLYGAQITDRGLEDLKQLKNLEELNLSYCRKITDGGLEHVGAMENLTSLELTGCILLSDRGLAHLHKLKKLRVLDLKLTRVTAGGTRALKTALPNLRLVASLTPASLTHTTGPHNGLDVTVVVSGYLDNETKLELVRRLRDATDEPNFTEWSVADRGGNTVFKLSNVIDVEIFLSKSGLKDATDLKVEGRRISLAMEKASPEPLKN